MRPLPADPIAAAMGSLAGPGPDSDELRAQARADEDAAERRRYGRLRPDHPAAGGRREPTTAARADRGGVMTVLAAYAIIAYLTGEPAAPSVADLLRQPDVDCCIATPNVTEVVDVLVRGRGQDVEDVLEKLDWLAAAGLLTVPADDSIARAAGRIRSAHYRRVDAPVSLADCLTLATAQVLGHALATADPDLGRVAASVGIEVIALPDASGRLPRSS